jgi:hypothetical protein
LGSFLKITQEAQNIWATFFHGKNNAQIRTKICWAYILGDFFTNSFGHSPKNRKCDYL